MYQSNTDSKYISLDIPVPPTQATDDICRHYQRRVSHSVGSLTKQESFVETSLELQEQ